MANPNLMQAAKPEQQKGYLYMLALTKKPPEGGILPLGSAVFCLDCEMISNSRDDACPACNSRSLVSLARMLGGGLGSHRKSQPGKCEGDLFDIRIIIQVKQMLARDVTTTLEKLSNVIAPHLASEQATLHINVKPTADKLSSEGTLALPGRDAA